MTRRNQPEAATPTRAWSSTCGGALVVIRGGRTSQPAARRSPIEAAIFKSLGVRAGAPDLLIVRTGQALFLELKAPGRKLSPAQTECHDALRRAGATVETADNIDAAIAFLNRIGAMR